MKEIFNNYVLPSGILLTFIATCINIYFTRKSIKSSKYIDTITTERIKWLSIIRIEVSELISIISETLIFYKEQNEQIEFQNPNEDYITDVNYKNHLHSFDSLTKNSFYFNKKFKYGDIIKRLYILKLRFNPIDDKLTINLIDFFLDFYRNEYKSDIEIKKGNEKIEEFTNNIQLLLKKEWEKVKKESKGKI